MSQTCMTSAQHGVVSVMWKTVSEDCNLACDYCYYSTVGGKPGSQKNRIDPAVLEKFMKEYMAQTKGVASFVWQGGEPLLAGLEFFEEVVALQAKYAPHHTMISNAIQTNGTLINEKWARFFKKYNFLVGVSLDGPKEIHDERRVTASGKGSFDKVMQGIEHLRKANVDFNILTVLHEKNMDKAKELMEFYIKERFQYVQFIPCMDFRAQEAHKTPKYTITADQYGNFMCQVFDHWYNEGEPFLSIRLFDNMLHVYLDREAEACNYRKTCPRTLILERNGDAYPCDFYIHEDYKLGNVGVDSLKDILKSPVYKEFLQMKPNLPQECISCEFLKLCHGGCPRNRMWKIKDEAFDVDYFCEGYKQIYKYAHDRMTLVANKIRMRWIHNHIQQGKRLPYRDDFCLCGSYKKFNRCCEPLALEMNII